MVITDIASLARRLSRTSDGSDFKSFIWFCDIDYGSEKHLDIIRKVISRIKNLNLVKDEEDILDEFGSYKEFALTTKVFDKLLTDMRKTYAAGKPFPQKEMPEDITLSIENVCDYTVEMAKKAGGLRASEHSLLKRDSSLGFPFFANTLQEKMPIINLAFDQIQNSYEGPFKANIYMEFHRRQWKSTGNKLVAKEDGLLHEVERMMDNGRLMARNRITAGASPVQAATSMLIQRKDKHYDELLGSQKKRCSINSDFMKWHDGGNINLDVRNFDSEWSDRIKRSVDRSHEYCFDLPGYSKWSESEMWIYRTEDGKVSTSRDVAMASGKCTVSDSNQANGAGRHFNNFKKLNAVNNLTDFFAHRINGFNLLFKGDDSSISSTNLNKLREYKEMISSDPSYKIENPGAFLGFITYNPTGSRWRFEYNVENVFVGLMQKERDNTTMFYLSYISKKEILERTDLGKKLLAIYEDCFNEVVGSKPLDYAKSLASEAEIAASLGLYISDNNFANIMVKLNPNYMRYKYSIGEVDENIIKEYFLSTSPDDLDVLLKDSAIRAKTELRQLSEYTTYCYDSLEKLIDAANSKNINAALQRNSINCIDISKYFTSLIK